jgi:hypothetical protein
MIFQCQRIISKCVRLLLIQPQPVWTDELEGLRILSLFDDLCFLNSQSTAPDLLHLQLEVKLQMILDRVTSHLFRHSSVLCIRQVLPVRLANLPAGKTISNDLWSSKLQYWSALPDRANLQLKSCTVGLIGMWPVHYMWNGSGSQGEV